MALVFKLRFLIFAILNSLAKPNTSCSCSYSYSAQGGIRTRNRIIAREYEHEYHSIEYEYERCDKAQLDKALAMGDGAKQSMFDSDRTLEPFPPEVSAYGSVIAFASTEIFRCLLLLIVGMILSMAIGAGYVNAQYRDDFEGGRPRLRKWKDDCDGRIVQSQLTQLMPNSGVSSEMVDVQCGYGSYMYLEYALPRSAILDELQLALSIRSAPSGMRPAFRVVFPRTAHPATSDPLTTLLFGTPTRGGGTFSRVEVRGVMALLADQQRVLRTQFGSAIDLRDAYIDAVVIDVYNGPGNTKLQIDDLNIEGLVPANAVIPRDLMRENRDGTTTDQRQYLSSGAVADAMTPALALAERARDLRASVPRWIQYRGESIEWLQSLGFNGLVLSEPATPQILSEATRLNLALIAPPPALMPRPSDQFAYAPVQAWSIGWLMDASQIDDSRMLSTELLQYPQTMQRPTIVEAMEAFSAYGRMADILAIPVPAAASLRSQREAEQLLRSSLNSTRGRTIPLTSMVLEPTQEWTTQYDRIANSLRSNALLATTFDTALARSKVLRSISQESRGWYFRSLRPLDDATTSTMDGGTQRIDSYKAIAAELELISPWIQSGEPATPIPLSPALNYVAHRITMPRSQLITLCYQADYDSMVLAAPDRQSLELTLPRQEQTIAAYRITRGRLESIAIQPSPEGWKLVIPQPTAIEMLVMTEDPRAIAYLQTRIRDTALSMCESRLSMAEQALQTVQMALVAEQVLPNSPAWREVSLAEADLRTATQHLMRSDLHQTMIMADAAWRRGQRLLRASWDRARESFASPQSSVLLTSAMSLPLHWETQRTLANRDWQPLSIPGNDADQNQMLTAGWSVFRRLEDRVKSDWQVVSNAGSDSSAGLYMEAKSIDSGVVPGGYAGTSMLLSSPRIELPPDSLVHIQMLVRVAECSDLPQSGILVYDSTAGSGVGQLVNLQSTDSKTWQRVSLYRMTSAEEGIQIQIELRGEVKAAIDQIRIDSLMLSPDSQFPTRVIDPVELAPGPT
ncbi:MAG: hypothetical protein NTW52_10685 [Planctomycetota bacterium]|nr:hypothetical protein [Planctomycetota bacterium]